MDSHQRVAIIGGGIFGHGVAYALGREGWSHLEVFDRGGFGSGATALAAGILSLQTWNDADARLIRENRGLVEDLVEWGRGEGLAAADHTWHQRGGVTIADEGRLPILEEIAERMRRLDEPADVVGPDEAQKRFPQFSFGRGERILHSPGDGTLESTDLLELVRRRCLGFGVRFRPTLGVAELRMEGARAMGLKFDNGIIERFDRVVVAAGAWTGRLLHQAGIPLAAIPYRTQLATLELDASDRLPVLHDTVGHFYARPESGTRFLAGDGTQLSRFDPESFNRSADSDFVHSIAERIVGRFREGAQARFRTGWAGLCVGTPDRRPLAGPLPGVEGLSVLTGDNGFGLMRGLALGRVVADTLQSRTSDQTRLLDPGRFGHPPPLDFPLSEGFSLPD